MVFGQRAAQTVPYQGNASTDQKFVAFDYEHDGHLFCRIVDRPRLAQPTVVTDAAAGDVSAAFPRRATAPRARTTGARAGGTQPQLPLPLPLPLMILLPPAATAPLLLQLL
ncbi:hypothetical protein Pelo_19500 [Pelomyxa schiedti]|nr:hypothetical protein Pelo_19500 [Pelomyxa schiedti]